MTVNVVSWWIFLCAAAALNLMAWSWSAVALKRRRLDLCSEAYSVRRVQLLLSAVYVLGCGFRSVLPLYDVPRLCIVDSWLCNVAVGRSVATVAELCFVAQWAVMLNELSHATGNRMAWATSRMLVPLIAIAEVFSWYSVLTMNNIGHVVEETLWGTSAVLLVASLVVVRPSYFGAMRRLLDVCCVAGVVYVAYMVTIDVPMYWSRWVADEASGSTYFSIARGFADATGQGTVSHRWEDWNNEVIWMSLYFSVAVWFSISLVHAPAQRGQARSTIRT